MNLYIGIDLGTSAVKLLLVNEKGEILKTVTKEYPLRFPKPGWSEQDPADWWRAVQHGILQLTEHADKSLIRGIGCGGQMHASSRWTKTTRSSAPPSSGTMAAPARRSNTSIP